jgi:hypothetical protein
MTIEPILGRYHAPLEDAGLRDDAIEQGSGV